MEKSSFFTTKNKINLLLWFFSLGSVDFFSALILTHNFSEIIFFSDGILEIQKMD